MGANQSKEEQLYKEVQNGNHDAVRSLRREGASLEWVDKEGRTPLILACTRGELLDMVVTLVNLGANMNAYRAGAHGGFPIHHAAKRGLEKTVTLLLSHGANPLAVNDDGHTALDMARNRGHAAVVRLLEEKLCIYSGVLREISGFGVLESLAPKLVTKKVWGVVLPTKPAVHELAIYESPKVSLWNGVHSSSTHPAGLCNVAQPRTRISLANANIEEPNYTLADPVVYIMDKAKTKYKFYAETKGDKAQLERFYKACKGIPLAQNVALCGNDINPHTGFHPAGNYQQGNLSQVHPMSLQRSPGTQPVLQSVSAPSSGVPITVNSHTPVAEPIPEELALALALDESIRTAAEEGIYVSPTSSSFNISQLDEWDVADEIYRGWSPCVLNKQQDRRPIKSDHSEQTAEQHFFNRWAADGSGSRLQDLSILEQPEQPIGAHPSAPPLLENQTDDGFGGVCVVCWDARAEGVCIPCGHLAGCMNCLIEVKSKSWNCPVCRGPIEQVIKVYAV